MSTENSGPICFSLLVCISLSACGTVTAMADAPAASTSVGLPEGAFEVAEYWSDDKSHDDAVIVISEIDSGFRRYDLFFNPIKGDYKGQPTGCLGTERLDIAQGSYICDANIEHEDYDVERFVLGALSSPYCETLRQSFSTLIGSPAAATRQNPIMDPTTCSDEKGHDCICYRVTLCKDGDDDCGVRTSPEELGSQYLVEPDDVNVAPGNGSGSGGRWP